MHNAPSLHRHQKKLAAMPQIDGTITSFTIVRNPPAGFGSKPYTVALITHDDGSKICAQLTEDGLTPAIGARVSPRMRKIRTLENGLIVYDRKYAVIAGAREPQIKIQHYVLALTGPSGVGKTTITRTLLHLFSSYAEQVPIYTTRKPKREEVEPYTYITSKKFDELLATGEMIAETTMQSTTEDRRYGYIKSDIEAMWNAGKLPIVVTDIHLLKGLEKHLGRRAILSCGLLPPGKSRRRMLSALLHRLRTRGRDTEEQIRERIEIAKTDLAAFDTHPHLFDHLVVNDELDVCVERIRGLVEG
jgi:guanylate kinase